MDFRDSPEDAAFRQEVRAFLAAEFSRCAGAPSGPAASAEEERQPWPGAPRGD